MLGLKSKSQFHRRGTQSDTEAEGSSHTAKRRENWPRGTVKYLYFYPDTSDLGMGKGSESPKSATSGRSRNSRQSGRSGKSGQSKASASRGSVTRSQTVAAPLAHPKVQRLKSFLAGGEAPETKAVKKDKEGAERVEKKATVSSYESHREKRNAAQEPPTRFERSLSEGRRGLWAPSQESQTQAQEEAAQSRSRPQSDSQSQDSEAQGSLSERSEEWQAKGAQAATRKLMRADLTLKPGGRSWRIDEGEEEGEDGEEGEGTLRAVSDFTDLEDLREELAGTRFEKSLIETRLKEVLKAMERELEIATMASEAVQKKTEKDAAETARIIQSLKDENEALEDQMRQDVLMLTFKLDAVEEEKAEVKASYMQKVRELTDEIEALQEENRELHRRRHEAGADALQEAFREFNLIFEDRLRQHKALASRQAKSLPHDTNGQRMKGHGVNGQGVKGHEEEGGADRPWDIEARMLDRDSWSVRREEVEKEMNALIAQLDTLEAERNALQLIAGGGSSPGGHIV